LSSRLVVADAQAAGHSHWHPLWTAADQHLRVLHRCAILLRPCHSKLGLLQGKVLERPVQD